MVKQILLLNGDHIVWYGTNISIVVTLYPSIGSRIKLSDNNNWGQHLALNFCDASWLMIAWDCIHESQISFIDLFYDIGKV